MSKCSDKCNRNSYRPAMEESRTKSIIYRIGAYLIVSSLLLTTAVSADKQITLLDEGGGHGTTLSRWRRGSSGGDLMGQRTNCDNEGEEFPTPNGFSCFQCICRNGFVECEREQCPSVDECYYLEKKHEGCCKRCRECSYNGTTYKSGSEWNDPEDPCSTYKCLGGVVTQVNLQCHTPCSFPMRPKPDSGQCCPTCVGCKYNGQTVLEGQEVTSSEDPCLKCQCNNRRLECTKKACPVVNCPLQKQVKEPGECCPKCVGQLNQMSSLHGRCLIGGKLYSNGQKFQLYGCSTCVCNNGTSFCRRVTCPVLDCPVELQTGPEDGSCCKKCPEVAEMQSVCVYNQQTYQHDETWNLDSCRSCRCVNGRPNCAEMKCPELRCKANEVKVYNGQCCAKCVETAGICTVFGDPHYKTFDGKFFSFQGMCKYQLTADCVGHSFSIRVTNDGRSTKSSSWTKTVTLKVNNLKVNLGQKMRVKVNGTRVALPYTLYSPEYSHAKDFITDITPIGNSITTITTPASHFFTNHSVPEVEIFMTDEGISVKTRIGVQLLWDGTNFLQVQAPVHYKNRLCGLCGNYNGVSRDDFRTRRGVNMNENTIWDFANSWRVGGIKTCSGKHHENSGRKLSCKYRKKGAMCRPLEGHDSIFESCTERVNPSNYHLSCHKDMCECESDLCYCDSFTAYAHECQRLGIPLPDWRKKTNCTLEAMKKAALVLPRSHNKSAKHRLVHKKRNKEEEFNMRKLESQIPKELIDRSRQSMNRKDHLIPSQRRRPRIRDEFPGRSRSRTPLPLIED